MIESGQKARCLVAQRGCDAMIASHICFSRMSAIRVAIGPDQTEVQSAAANAVWDRSSVSSVLPNRSSIGLRIPSDSVDVIRHRTAILSRNLAPTLLRNTVPDVTSAGAFRHEFLGGVRWSSDSLSWSRSPVD